MFYQGNSKVSLWYENCSQSISILGWRELLIYLFASYTIAPVCTGVHTSNWVGFFKCKSDIFPFCARAQDVENDMIVVGQNNIPPIIQLNYDVTAGLSRPKLQVGHDTISSPASCFAYSSRLLFKCSLIFIENSEGAGFFGHSNSVVWTESLLLTRKVTLPFPLPSAVETSTFCGRHHKSDPRAYQPISGLF